MWPNYLVYVYGAILIVLGYRYVHEGQHAVYLHKLTLGMLCECQTTLRLVTKILPLSPALPFVSSIESNLSIKISPGRIFVWLWEGKKDIWGAKSRLSRN